MRSPNHTIVRAVTRDPQVLARFWASVDRAEGDDACWEWRHWPTPNRYPVFRVKHYAVSAARLAWFAATGEFPLAGRIRHTCANILCVRPEHLEWELGMMGERQLRANSNGYGSVAGVQRGVRGAEEEDLRRAS
jgi:hypothetical protein